MSAPERVHDREEQYDPAQSKHEHQDGAADQHQIANGNCVAHSGLSTMSLPRLIREAISLRVSGLMICPKENARPWGRPGSVGRTSKWGQKALASKLDERSG